MPKVKQKSQKILGKILIELFQWNVHPPLLEKDFGSGQFLAGHRGPFAGGQPVNINLLTQGEKGTMNVPY
jgi:hypothetical protein